MEMITTKESFQNKELLYVLVRKSKKLYYNNLDRKKVTYNQTFCKTIKPFLSGKIASREKLTLIEDDKSLKVILIPLKF